MRRFLIFLAGVAVLTLPAAASARAHASSAAPGFLVVRNASTNNGITGRPVVTVVVRGFVIGRIAQEGAVELYHLEGPSAGQAAGIDVSRRAVLWRGVPGTRFTGSDFRFRAVGGVWRVVVYGAGISLYAGGVGPVTLHGSVSYPGADGTYSLNGGPFLSLPSNVVAARLEEK